MPTPRPSLYGFFVEGLPYVEAALCACTVPLEGVEGLTLAGLGEPTTPGYARYRAADLAGLFDSIDLVPGRLVRLVSKVIHWHHAGVADQPLTGVALVVWTDANTPLVVAVVPSATIWPVGKSTGGRLYLTAIIHDEGV